MMNSRMKDKIYALLSFVSIISAIGSFAFAVNFLLQTNEYIFNVNEKTVKEKTTIADKAGFESIKAKLKLKENISAESFQGKSLQGAPASDISAPDILPSSSPSASSSLLPSSPAKTTENMKAPDNAEF